MIQFILFVDELRTLIHIVLYAGLVGSAPCLLQDRLWFRFSCLSVHAFAFQDRLVPRHEFHVLCAEFGADLILLFLGGHAGFDRARIRNYLL